MKQYHPHDFAPPQHSEMPSMAELAPTTKHYPARLRCVRELFLRTEYRKCVQTCTDLLQTPGVLSHPIQTAFLHFYSALAYDEMGRAMHHNSTAKIPALDTAEQSYLAALDALPSCEDTELLCLSLAQKSRADSFFDPGEPSPSDDGDDVFDQSSPVSSPARGHSHSFSIRSALESPAVTTSDLDDLESHDSFSELLTPSRVLNRDNSLSLLENTPYANNQSRHMSGPYDPPTIPRMQREFSRMSLLETPPRKPMSQGLLHPIRPGSAPKPFYFPPRLADTSQIPRGNAADKQAAEMAWNSSPRKRIPTACDSFLEDRHHNLEPVSPISLEDQHNIDELVSPISPIDPYHADEPVSPINGLGSAHGSSDVSTISAVSPVFPNHGRKASLPSDEDVDHSLCLRFNDHIDSMRMQLETHIALVKGVKEQHREFQAERALSRLASTTAATLRKRPGTADRTAGRNERVVNNQAPVSPGGLPRLRSFWSFVPVDAKAAEKQRRIQAGRDRNWERKTERFDATKYQDLCERALAEL